MSCPPHRICLFFISNLALFSVLRGQQSSDSTLLLKFTDSDWSVPKTVIVYGVDDEVEDGNQRYAVAVGPSESEDSTYNGLTSEEVSVINLDDETDGETSQGSDSNSDESVSGQVQEGPAILLSGIDGVTTSEGGSSATFTVRLASEPSANVFVPLRISDGSEGSFSPQPGPSGLGSYLGQWGEWMKGWVADNRGGLLVGAMVGGSVTAWILAGSEKETVIQPPSFPLVP